MKVRSKSKVSAIVPAYNAEKTIGKTIDLLLQQTYHNLEIIVINDGSADRTLQIITKKASKDRRVMIIDQNNAGPGAARNAGLRAASGEYIVFFDADDDFALDIIENLVKRQSETEADFIFCGMTTNGRAIVPVATTLKGQKAIIRYCLRLLASNNLLYGPYCKLFKKELIDSADLHFQTKVNYGEDTIFVLSYLKLCSSLASVNESLYHYNYQTSGIAFKNRTSIQSRSARSQALRDFVWGGLSVGNLFWYLIIKLRWLLSFLKAKIR